MNDNRNGFQNNNEKEEIRFDEKDFQNPYADIFPLEINNDTDRATGGAQPGKNPYDDYFNDSTYNSANNSTNTEGGNPYSEPYTAHHSPAEELKTKKHFSRIGLGYALFSVITLAVSLIIANVVYRVNPEFYSTTLFLNLLTPVSLYIFALPVLLIVLSRTEAKAPEKRKMGFGEWLLFLIASFGFMYIGSIIGNAVMDYLSALMNYDYSNGLESIVDNDNLLITAFFTVIVAPIGEEFVFRKLIIDRTHKYGPMISIGLSGLMFGLMHSNFYQFFYCFALGIILGYVYYTTGKLYLTIALHAVINFVGGILTTLLAPISDALLNVDLKDPAAIFSFVQKNIYGVIGLAIFTVFVYVSMACAVILPLVFRKKLIGRLRSENNSHARGRQTASALINSGMIAMFAIYLAEMVLNLLPI